MAQMKSELILSLVDRVTGPARRVHGAMRGIEEAQRRNRLAVDETRSAMINTAGVAVAAAAALSQPVRAAMRFEEVMADVRKVVDFPTPEGYAEFREELLALSREIPLTVQQLGEIAAAGGSSGLDGEQLIQFTRLTAQLATAFDVPAEAAADFTNAMRNSLGLTLDEVNELADAVNHLTNSMAAEAPAMAEFMASIAGTLKTAGFTPEEAAAFGAAMQAQQFSADVSATSFRNMAKALTRGESATKRQSDAYKKLGLDAEDVARRMQEDAVGTTLEVIDAIGKLPKEVRAAVSSDLFGDEARALNGLISNVDLLREALGYVDDEAEYAGSALKEYIARSETFASDLQRFQNVAAELSITIGEALLPSLANGMDAMTPIIRRATEWSKENADLIQTIVRLSGALIGLRFGLLGLRLIGLTGKGGVLWAAASGLRALNAAAQGSLLLGSAAGEAMRLQAALARMQGLKPSRIEKIGAALRGISGASGLTAVAGAASSLVWPVTLAALAVGATVKWFDRLKAIASGVVGAISDELAPAFEALEPILGPVKSVLSGIASAAGDVISSIGGFFTGGLFEREILPDAEAARIEARAREMTENIIAAIKALPSKMKDLGADAIQSLIDGMKDRLAALLDWVREIPSQVMEAIGTINLGAAVTGPGSSGRAANRTEPPADQPPANATGSAGRLEARALGGPITAGVPYLVNEDTPRSEVIVPSVSGAVLNVAQAQRAMALALRGSRPAKAPDIRIPAIRSEAPQSVSPTAATERLAEVNTDPEIGDRVPDVSQVQSSALAILRRAASRPGSDIDAVRKRTVERLVERSVIVQPPTVDVSGPPTSPIGGRRAMAMLPQILAQSHSPALSPAPASIPQPRPAPGQARQVENPSLEAPKPVAQNFSVSFGDIVIPGGANASASDIARDLGREVEALLGAHFSDAGI